MHRERVHSQLQLSPLIWVQCRAHLIKKDEAARMKVTPPLAVAPLAHGDDMRWNPNDDGINFNPY